MWTIEKIIRVVHCSFSQVTLRNTQLSHIWGNWYYISENSTYDKNRLLRRFWLVILVSDCFTSQSHVLFTAPIHHYSCLTSKCFLLQLYVQCRRCECNLECMYLLSDSRIALLLQLCGVHSSWNWIILCHDHARNSFHEKICK